MNYLKNTILNIFSADVGLSEAGISAALEAISTNQDHRELEGIIRDFEELMRQADTNWLELLDNENYEVAVFESQEQARLFIIENIMKPLGYIK